jgi:hypothetical protein
MGSQDNFLPISNTEGLESFEISPLIRPGSSNPSFAEIQIHLMRWDDLEKGCDNLQSDIK